MKNKFIKNMILALAAVSMAILPFLEASLTTKAASNVTVNVSSKKQIIRGFGASSAWCGVLSDTCADTLYKNVGLDILRVRIEPNEGWKTGDYSKWATELANAKKVAARGGIVFATPWSAPASMKTNNSVAGTNNAAIKPGSYGDYANYLKAFVNYYKNNGVPLYAISLQNEPDWPADYDGCHWSATDFQNFIKTYGASIANTTRIMMPESLGFNQALSNPTLIDSTTAPYVSIIGGHLYGATIKDYPLASTTGKDIWMTEHYYEGDDISTSMNLAKEINDCMTVGNMNAYVYWWIINNGNGLYTTSGSPIKRAYILGQYSKFVRFGYSRVDATSNPQTDVYVSAYTGDNKAVIVAINKGTSQVSQSFNIQSGSASKVASWVTSASQNMAKSADINVANGSFTASLPAQSVTTFVADLGGTTTTPTTPTVPTTSGIEVTYAVANNWGTGASINVTIKNNGTTPINGWNLAMPLPSGQTISSLWNASYTTSGSTATVTNSSYNGTIAANGGTQTFGFNLNYSGTFSKPSSIKLNGVACTIK